MANNKTLVPEAKSALDKFKMEAASEVGVTLKQGYNGDLTAKQAGSVGGQMVKKMIQGGQNIPVDVTAVKQVKKTPGGKPGMVIYHTYRTVIVNPYKDIVVDPLNAEKKVEE